MRRHRADRLQAGSNHLVDLHAGGGEPFCGMTVGSHDRRVGPELNSTLSSMASLRSGRTPISPRQVARLLTMAWAGAGSVGQGLLPVRVVSIGAARRAMRFRGRPARSPARTARKLVDQRLVRVLAERDHRIQPAQAGPRDAAGRLRSRHRNRAGTGSDDPTGRDHGRAPHLACAQALARMEQRMPTGSRGCR